VTATTRKVAIGIVVLALWGASFGGLSAFDKKPSEETPREVTMESHLGKVEDIVVDEDSMTAVEDEDLIDLDVIADSAGREVPGVVEEEPCEAPAQLIYDTSNVPSLGEVTEFWQNEYEDQADALAYDLSEETKGSESSDAFSKVEFRGPLETIMDKDYVPAVGRFSKFRFWLYFKSMWAGLILIGCSKWLVGILCKPKDILSIKRELTDFDTLLDFIMAFQTIKSNAGRRCRSPPAKKSIMRDLSNYEKLTVPELEAILKGFNVKASGNKTTLIQMLMEQYAATLTSKGFTKGRIAAILKARGVSFSSKAKKDELILLAVQSGF